MEEKIKELNNLLNDYIVSKRLEENIVFQNIELFYILANKLLPLLEEFNKNNPEPLNIENIEKVSIFDMMEIIKNFYKQYNIEINIDSLIETGYIDFNLTNSGESKFDLNGVMHNEKEKNFVDFNNNGLIIDIPVIVHELGHFRNRKTTNATQTNCLLTESLARTDELLMSDYLSNNGYDDSMKKLRIHFLKNQLKQTVDREILFKSLYFYSIFGDVSKDNYELLFSDLQDYEQFINASHEMFKKKKYKYLISPASYLLDTYFSCYLFLRYKEDNNFLNTINELNESVKTEDMLTFLKQIGLNDFGELDQQTLLSSVKIFMNNLTEEKIKTL